MGADFPTSITDRLKETVNNLALDLTDDVLIDDDVINVATTAGAPDASSFHIESEVIYYTGKTALTFTGCVRGRDGTSAAVHTMKDGGKEVIFGPEAHHVNNLNEEMVAIQTKVGKDSATDQDSHDYKLTPRVKAHTPADAATATLDIKESKFHKVTMPAGNITLAIDNFVAGKVFMLNIVQDSVGSRLVTWFDGIIWEGGTVPTLTTDANAIDTFGFYCPSTGVYQGYVIGQDMKAVS